MIDEYGRYVAERELGRGGMGVVFRGHDPMLDRPVAIKLLKVGGDATPEQREQYRERFLREARAVARLSHPHIVTVFDVGVTADGNAFLVMELVEGESLEARVKRDGALAPELVARIGSAVAGALGAAHQAGIVHRDVKPANILLGPDDTAKLMDFGIARVAESTLTVAGQFLGSPLYSSPEQLRGVTVDPRADLYSLGVTAYVLLTGRHPFARATFQETVRAIVQDPAKSVSAVRPELDTSWDALLAQVMAKDPDARPAQAATVAEMFIAAGSGQLLVANTPPTAAPPPPLVVVVERGPDRGLRATVDRPMTVGRGRGDLALMDGAVSGQHCAFEPHPGGLLVRDLKSSNGTFVDDQRIESQLLTVGMTVRLGTHTVLRIEEPGSAVDEDEATGTMVDAIAPPSPTLRPLSGAPKWALMVNEGPRQGTRLEIGLGLVLSRDQGDGRLDDPKVSRKHASLEVRGARLFLRDLASTNGTWMAEQRVREVELKRGDRFRVGQTVLTVDHRSG